MKGCPIYTYLVMHLHKHTLTYINNTSQASEDEVNEVCHYNFLLT